MANPKKRLSSLMVYLDLKENSSFETMLSKRTIEKNLEEKYGKENRPSHNTIGLILKDMKDNSELLDIDVRKGNQKQGYYLANREFNEWEINLFVEAIINSKTLDTFEKKELIEKCFNHLGLLGGEEVEKIIDSLYGKEVSINDEINVQENLELINKAIKNNKKIKVFVYYGGSNNRIRIRFLKIISPYKVFGVNNHLYLLYFYKPKSNSSRNEEDIYLRYERIENLKVKGFLKEDAYDIRKVKGFEKGFDEKKFRKNPLAYISGCSEQTVVAEIIKENVKNERQLKKDLTKYFINEFEIMKNSSKEFLYLNDQIDLKKSYEFFLTRSDIYKVTKPLELAMTLKHHAINMFKTYMEEKTNNEEYQYEPNEGERFYGNKRVYRADYISNKV